MIIANIIEDAIEEPEPTYKICSECNLTIPCECE